MTHEEMSLHTRQAMTGSLKKFMGLKPLSQITVSEICADCNLNRKTFYYHFEDIYDLLHWMLEQEALTVVKQFDMPGDYDKVISFVIDYVDDNSHILNCIYDSVGREDMKRFFSADFKMYIGFLIEEAEKEASLTLESSYRQFLCDFYINALTGIFLDWFLDRSIRTREEMTDYLTLTLKNSIKSAVAEGVPAGS